MCECEQGGRIPVVGSCYLVSTGEDIEAVVFGVVFIYLFSFVECVDS